MGNRVSRKTQRASAATAVQSHEAVVVAAAPSPVQPKDELLLRKDGISAEKKEAELPLSAREAPTTARDDGNNEDNPLEFFRQCYALEEDPFTPYTQALLLKDQREFAAASELLRSMLSNSSLSLEAHYHLAQCLFAQDPALRSCREEVVRCLENVLATTKSSSKSGDAHETSVYRESLGMLAHVMIAGRRFDRALELLDALQVELDADASPPSQTANRQQQTLVSFQRAFCRYARGESPEAISSELLRVLPQKTEQEPDQHEETSDISDPLECIELLLHADAASLREGLLLLVSTST